MQNATANKPTPTTRETVLAFMLAGVPPRRIAAALDVSQQAVYQHIKALRAEGLLPDPAEAAS